MQIWYKRNTTILNRKKPVGNVIPGRDPESSICNQLIYKMVFLGFRAVARNDITHRLLTL